MELDKKGYPIYKDKKRFVHRYIAWRYLLNKSRPLEKWEEVHHIDGNKLNYSPENLIIFSKEDHYKISKRLHKERNLNKANAVLFGLVFVLFMFYKDNQSWGILDRIISILLFVGILVSVYPNVVNLIMKKTKLYKIISDDLDPN